MDTAVIQRWVRRRKLGRLVVELLLALGCLLVGAIELVTAFGITYLTVHFSLNWWLRQTHETSMRVGLGVVVLMFLLNPWASRRPKPVLPPGHRDLPGEGFPPKLSALLRYADVNTYVDPLPPSALRTAAYALCTGPRVLLRSVHRLAAAVRAARVDVRTCADTIALLMDAEHKIPLAELRAAYWGADFERTLVDLWYLHGVLFLVQRPVGLLLSSRARRELNEALGLRAG